MKIANRADGIRHTLGIGICVLMGCVLLPDPASAVGRQLSAALLSPALVTRVPHAKSAVRSKAPVTVATSTGPGQSGYVHFFVIKDPDQNVETQIGIELDDQRIAWSFPGLGVTVSPFIETGTVDAHGTRYEVQHLYGIRPFPDEKSMRALQKELTQRVLFYVEGETPYCYVKTRKDAFCLSCLDFVVRVLFPGRSPESPALPRDLQKVTAGPSYTTDDFLIYLLGLHDLPTQRARRKRIDELALPANLREEALRLVDQIEPAPVSTADSSAKGRSRPPGKIAQQRGSQRKKL